MSNEASLAFSGVKTVNLGGNTGSQRNAHPQLAISPTSSTQPGQVIIGWEDFGSLSTASPPLTILESSFVAPGNTYGFNGGTGFIKPGTTPVTNQGNWGPATVYSAGPNPLVGADPVSIAVADVDGNGANDIVVADMAPNSSPNSGIGVLLNTGNGLFPAGGVTAAGLFGAGSSPSSVVLQNFIAGHTVNTIPDAAVANNGPTGGVSLLANGTPPNDGQGKFSTVGSLNTTPPQGGTNTVVADHFDGTSQWSIVAVNSTAHSISWFPDGSATASGFLSTGSNIPISVVSANFRGGPADLAVLYSNGNIQLFRTPAQAPASFRSLRERRSRGLAPSRWRQVASTAVWQTWSLPTATAMSNR